MEEERPYWNMDVEPLLGTPDIEALQERRLKEQLERLYGQSRLWKKYMDDLGVRPGDVGTLGEFSRAFPTVDKDQMRALLFEFLGDRGLIDSFSSWVAAPYEEVVLVTMTSGTTGEPTPYFFTKRDLDLEYESFARLAWRCGLRPGDAVLHAMALSMFGAGVPLVQAVEAFGAKVLPVGAELGTERILHMARTARTMFGLDAMFVTPSLAEYLIDRCEDVLAEPASKLGVRMILCGGEPGAGLPEVRKKIEEGFGAKVFDGMGLGPVGFASCDHPEYQGMHLLTEDMLLFELVDPESKEPIPLEDGASGAAVMTPLAGDSLNVLRHFSGDVMEVGTSPCPCGRSGIRMKVVGRTDDMMKVKGVMVYPSALDNVIASFVPEVTGEFRIVLDEPLPRVAPPLTLKVEHREGADPVALEPLAARIAEEMHNVLKVRPVIEWVPPGTFERSVHKTAFFEKRYEKGRGGGA